MGNCCTRNSASEEDEKGLNDLLIKNNENEVVEELRQSLAMKDREIFHLKARINQLMGEGNVSDQIISLKMPITNRITSREEMEKAIAGFHQHVMSPSSLVSGRSPIFFTPLNSPEPGEEPDFSQLLQKGETSDTITAYSEDTICWKSIAAEIDALLHAQKPEEALLLCERNQSTNCVELLWRHSKCYLEIVKGKPGITKDEKKKLLGRGIQQIICSFCFE